MVYRRDVNDNICNDIDAESIMELAKCVICIRVKYSRQNTRAAVTAILC